MGHRASSRRRRRLTSVACALLLNVATIAGAWCGPNAAMATQYSPPWAHLEGTYGRTYYPDHTPPDWQYYDTRHLGWGDGLLDGAGYAGYYHTNLSSYGVYENWKSDSILIIAGHGSAGVICAGEYVDYPWDPPTDPGPDGPEGFIIAKSNGAANSWPKYYVSNLGAHDIDDCLVGMFIGCYTANVDSTDGYGSLLDESRAKGIDTAIGWMNSVYAEPSAILGMGFSRAIWDPLSRSRPIDSPQNYGSGNDIDLMQYAYGYMYQQLPNVSPIYKEHLAEWMTKGWSSQTAYPAHYGNP